ncbi:hypothetical protein B5807_06903 [Epicoccum nigrum]|uniref:Uncharacterized protein n=1 Tax=Epicoccum nigrum TaxID=105696 RepID=A0A1Y2LY68_EPING|nr:hypothetical protein B5807_06903 [Epicoccum nigrum]
MDAAFRCMNHNTIDRTISRFVEWKHTCLQQRCSVDQLGSDMRRIITCMQNMDDPASSRPSRLMTNIQGSLVNCTEALHDLPKVVQEMKPSRLTFHLHLRLLATFKTQE